MVIWWNDNVREFLQEVNQSNPPFVMCLALPRLLRFAIFISPFQYFLIRWTSSLMALCNFPHSRHLFPSPEAIPSIWQLNSSQPPKFLPRVPSPPPYNANHATSHQSDANYDRRKIIERRHRTVGFTQSIRGTMNPAIVGDIDIHWEETYWRKARG